MAGPELSQPDPPVPDPPVPDPLVPDPLVPDPLVPDPLVPDPPLPPREAAVLAALRAADGRVVGRADLARAAGLDGLSVRRVDGVLAGLRTRLPRGALVTVRGRGWMLVDPSQR